MKSKSNARAISDERIREYEILSPFLDSMYVEFKQFSNKKPEAVLSKAKIQSVNKLLERIKALIGRHEMAEFLSVADEALVPQNSDVVLMLSQYKTALDRFSSDYRYYDNIDGEWKWR